MSGPKTSRLAALERRVERLTTVLIVQSILLAIVVLMSALRAAPLLTLCAIVAIPLLVVYRQSLPHWARSLGRFFQQLRDRRPVSPDPGRARTRRTPLT